MAEDGMAIVFAIIDLACIIVLIHHVLKYNIHLKPRVHFSKFEVTPSSYDRRTFKCAHPGCKRERC